jgi:hypothetical protein
MVNSHLLKPYRQAAKILGIPVRQLVEEYLSPLKGEPEQIGEEFRWTYYPKRECALAAAERFEAFAIEEKLKGSPHIGMVATKVLEHEGHWAVKPDYSEAPSIVFDIRVLLVAQLVSMGSFWNFRRLPKIP